MINERRENYARVVAVHTRQQLERVDDGISRDRVQLFINRQRRLGRRDFHRGYVGAELERKLSVDTAEQIVLPNTQ